MHHKHIDITCPEASIKLIPGEVSRTTDRSAELGFIMVALAVTETSIGLAIVGGYIVIIGLVSYLLKDRMFLCE